MEYGLGALCCDLACLQHKYLTPPPLLQAYRPLKQIKPPNGEATPPCHVPLRPT